MNSSEIIEQATAEGVTLALSPAGAIKATGDPSAVEKWLLTIRDHKAGILCELQREHRRATVLVLLEGKRFALFVDDDSTDPVIATCGIRDVATFELAIPRHSRRGYVRVGNTSAFLRWHDAVGIYRKTLWRKICKHLRTIPP